MEIEGRKIRKGASISLKGQYLKAVLFIALLIASFSLHLFLSNTVYLSLCSFVFVFCEILFYVLFWYYKKASLCQFNTPSPWKVLLLNISLQLLSLVWAFLFFSVPAAFWAVSIAAKKGIIYFSSEVLLFCLDAIVLILLAVTLVLYLFFMLRYFACPFILCENNEAKISEIIKTSVRIMKTESEKTAFFLLSLIGCIIPSLLILPAFYFIPKAIASVCLYARYIIEKNRIT